MTLDRDDLRAYTVYAILAFVVIVFALSGCGVIHNSLHPNREHCLYHCYDDALGNEKIKGLTDCESRELMFQLSISTCDLKCLME